MLSITNLTVRLGGRVIFENASLSVPTGHRTGLVGRNGSGKTTLFRVIAGELQADGGDINLGRRPRIGRVAQEAPDGPQSLLETVLAADEERASLLIEAETVTDPARIADVHARLVDIEAHAAPARAAQILAGLGFDEAAQARPCNEFSGGWRMRVALAGALFARPDLLLLDEPTNHLDLEATIWLENYLAGWRGTLFVISHERRLLNRVVGEIVHLHEHKLTRYVGNYDRYERTRRERLVRETKMRERQVSEQKRIQAFIDRFRVQANKARQAQSRVKMLARMEPIASVMEEHTTAFSFPSPNQLPPPIISLDRVAVGYEPEKPVLSNLDLRIDMEDRIALIGANGNGKSTLVKLFSGKLAAMEGRMRKPARLRIGYFAQHQTDELDMAGTPYTHLARLMPDVIPSKVRSHLGRFGFAQDKAEVRVSSLSGGEKARLLLAMMCLDAPHILFLDEPTNHLDVDSREALIEALNEFEGAVILVSHDAHLIDLVCDRLWLVADGTCTPFEGDLDDYAKMLQERRRAARRAGSPKTENGRREARKARADARAKAAPLRKAVRDAEKRLASLNKTKLRIESELALQETYNLPSSKVSSMQLKLAQTDRTISETEDAWLTAQSALEKAK
ncbi:MAG: ABC-F family ATP-binding cassette domain-containing protein [Rhodospirillales bacterium]|jgi:ATP-binding cassette, subfamily F, member 3|nr:ABC-F family ATP-binding cassette domain-containing protein [Rhodospirillales bacterium]